MWVIKIKSLSRWTHDSQDRQTSQSIVNLNTIRGFRTFHAEWPEDGSTCVQFPCSSRLNKKPVAPNEPRTRVRCVESGYYMPLPKWFRSIGECPEHHFNSVLFSECLQERAQKKLCKLYKRLPRRYWHLVPIKWRLTLDTAGDISWLNFFKRKT